MTLRYALYAALLLVAGIVTAVALTRWFIRHRARLIQRLIDWQQRLQARYPRAWRFLSARFARGEYLGLHLTIGLAISIGALWLFAGITEDVVRQEPLTRFDVTMLDWLQAHGSALGRSVAAVVTKLGSSVAITSLVLVVSVILAACREGLLLEGWIIALLGGGVLNEALKGLIQRPRPPHSSILSTQSWSFPSGHAMESLIAYGMVAYLVITLFPRARAHGLSVILPAAALILAIGFSRMYLGVHYFSDVVGGYAAGVLWLATCISGLEVARGWQVLERAKQRQQRT